MFCIKIRYVWWVNYNNWYKILLILVVVIRVIIYRIKFIFISIKWNKNLGKIESKMLGKEI